MVRDYIERIISLQKKKDYNSAYDVLQDALTRYPSNEFLLCSEVYLLLRMNKLKEARSNAETRLAILKNNPFFLRTYIEILSKDKDREAIINLSERLVLYPIRDEKLYTYLAGTLTRIGEKQKAIELLSSALSYIPGSRELSSFLDRLKESHQEDHIGYYRERFKDISPDRAITEIEAIMILPEYRENISLRLFLAELYKKKGDLHSALTVYSDCLKIKDSPYIRKMLGFLYYRMGEMDKAFPYLKDSFLENPQDHALFSTISKIIKIKENTKEAETLINEALARHPEARHLYGLMKRLRSWHKQ